MAQDVGRALMRAWVRKQHTIALTGAASLLAVTAALPLIWLVGQIPSAYPAASNLLTSLNIWLLLLRSVLLALAVTAVALIIGVPMGILIGRTDVVGRRPLWMVHAFGIFLPPFLLGLGWFHALGRQGWMGSDASARMLFSETGLVMVLGVAFAPVVTSLVALGVMGVDASLEEAARVVAKPFRVATRILLPMAWPSVTLAAIVVFALAQSELGVPMLLRVPVFPAAVFARLGGIDYAPGEAFVMVVPLVPIALLLLWLERHWVSGRSFTVLGLRGGSRTPLHLGRWRAPLSLTAWFVAAISALPIASLMFRATNHGTRLSELFEWAGNSPWNSLFASTVAATFIVVVGLIVGHALARKIAPARSLDALAVLSFVMPAAILGVGLIAIWNTKTTAFVYRTTAIVVIGYVARYAIVGIRVVASTVMQMPRHLEEAAASTGAGFLRRLRHIVIPLNARGIAFAWLMAVVFCLRDLETAVLYYPPGREPLTVRIFTLEANGPENIVAGLSVLQVMMTAVVLATGAFVLVGRAHR